MFDNLKSIFIGHPLKNEAIKDEKYNIIWGLPILASDALSSIAYATEEILLTLVPAIGVLAFSNLIYISFAIITLLIILVFSYTQTIKNYPNGGGSYIVASDNLGSTAGVIAGASLIVDYILTVAVSISSGTDAIISAYASLLPYKINLALIMLLLVMLGNLRGIRESSKIFSIPAYAFMIGILSMLFLGFFKYKTGFINLPPSPELVSSATQNVGLILILSAFSNGCSALTGVEAISNAVPNFKAPSSKNAIRVLILLASLVFIMFGGTSILASLYKIYPSPNKTVLSQIAAMTFGYSFMFYFVQLTTAIILFMAANTAYSGFPLLLSIIARDGFAPRQLSRRGDRLSFSNGIILLTLVAALLIIIFKGNVTSLIPLYAIGVFISFTLSQTGMFVKWLREKDPHWGYKASVNGFGAFVSGCVVVIITYTKFMGGAWIVVIVIPVLVLLMFKIKRHYISVAKQLHIGSEDLCCEDLLTKKYNNRIIVPFESINKASVRAFRYAKTISCSPGDEVIAFNVSVNEEAGQKILEKFSKIHTDIQLVVRYSPYRRIVGPLLDFIKSEEYNYKKGDLITVIIPRFNVSKWWQNLLHTQTQLIVESKLLMHKHIVVSQIPLQLKDE